MIETLQSRLPTVERLLKDAEGEILTFYDFPNEHRRQIYSTTWLLMAYRDRLGASAVEPLGVLVGHGARQQPRRGGATPVSTHATRRQWAKR